VQEMREVIAGIVVLVCLFFAPGSAFAYWVQDSGQAIGPGLPGLQGGYVGDNPGPGLPWLGNILSVSSRDAQGIEPDAGDEEASQRRAKK
jgi:hypothetical protein